MSCEVVGFISWYGSLILCRSLPTSLHVARTLVIMAEKAGGSDDDDGVSETATANEELIDLIQQWQRNNSNRDIKVVVAGKSGAGKSTLINNFLSLDENNSAETGLQPTSVTDFVEEYRGEVNGVPIQAIDMPGLHAQDHDEDKLVKIVAHLTHITDGKADILIYCIPLHQRMDMVDEKNIDTLNEVFGEIIWKNAVVAFTHADYILEKQRTGRANYDKVVADYRANLQITLRRSGVLALVTSLSSYHAIASYETGANSRKDPAPSTLGTSVDPEYNVTIVGVPTGEEPNKPSKWRQSLLSQIITIGLKNIGTMVLQLNGVQWTKVARILQENARARHFRAVAGGGVGVTLGGLLMMAHTEVLPYTWSTIATMPAGNMVGGALGLAGCGAALCILLRKMKRTQNHALAKEIAFYTKVNRKLKELRERLQE